MGIQGHPGTLRTGTGFAGKGIKVGTVKEKVFSFVLLGSNKIAAGPKLHSVFQINSLRWHFHFSKTSFSEIKCVNLLQRPWDK